jgi:hypothetical protein
MQARGDMPIPALTGHTTASPHANIVRLNSQTPSQQVRLLLPMNHLVGNVPARHASRCVVPQGHRDPPTLIIL